jgi:hypothetical protein
MMEGRAAEKKSPALLVVLVACFNEFERILRFASLATIGEGGDHGWEGECGKEVHCEAEQRGTPAA